MACFVSQWSRWRRVNPSPRPLAQSVVNDDIITKRPRRRDDGVDKGSVHKTAAYVLFTGVRVLSEFVDIKSE